MKIILLFFTLVYISFGLTQCAVPPEGGAAKGGGIRATKEAPFVNSLGMKFVPVPGTKVLFCTTETTVAQYQAAGMRYQAPGFNQGGDHPAVNVSWNDARSWCAWLSKKEGRMYRLPTDAEWSAAVGTSTYPWGNQWPPPNNAGNYAGQELRGSTPAERALLATSIGFTIIGGFSDGHKFTAPVGSYAANRYGLHDIGGNVGEWCEDMRTAVSGSRTIRDASWRNDPRSDLASSSRYYFTPDRSFRSVGFRCVVVQ